MERGKRKGNGGKEKEREKEKGRRKAEKCIPDNLFCYQQNKMTSDAGANIFL